MIDLSKERVLVEDANAALGSSNSAAARGKASSAIDALLARPEEERNAQWLDLLNRAGLAAWGSQDARVANRAWSVVLDARLRTLPAEHLDAQKSRLNLALTLKSFGDLTEARMLEEQALEVLLRTVPDDDRVLQVARLNLASTLRESGEFQGALALGQVVLDLRSRTLPDDHPDLQVARKSVANTLRQLGSLQGARALEEKVLAVLTGALPDDHPSLQGIRLNLAVTLKMIGDLERARELEEMVLEVYSRTLPEDHADLQMARGNLAGTIKALGDLHGARAIEETVLDVRSLTLPDDHPDLQIARANLAATIKDLGDLRGARVLEEKVLEVRSRALSDDHPDLQTARSNLAATLSALGDLPAARALQEMVLVARSRTLPDEHGALQEARQNLAVTIIGLGDLQGGRALEDKVLEVCSRTLPENDLYTQTIRGNLADTLRRLGDLHAAHALQERVLEVRLAALPDDHPDVQSARQNLAVTIATEHTGWPALGQEQESEMERARARCVELLTARCASERRAAQRLLLEAAPREAEERCAALSKGLGFGLSLAGGVGAFPASRELERPCFALSEATRGAALGAASMMRAAAGSPESRRLRDELASSSEALADLAAQGTTSEEFRTARQRREALERELVALGKELGGAHLAAVDFDAETLAATLGERDAIVAYRRFDRTRISVPAREEGSPAAAPVETSEASLCAFVLRRGTSEPGREMDEPGRDTSSKFAEPELTLVELGPIAPIESAVRAWREALGSAAGRGLSVAASTSGADLVARGADVRRLVLDPVSAALGDAQRVMLVLDDVLHLVPFDVLPSGEAPGELIGDRLRIETRATVTELLGSTPPAEGGTGLLAIGGVDFDRAGASAGVLVAMAEPEAGAPVTDSGAARKLPGLLRGGSFGGFTPLPATAAEVEALAESFRAQEDSAAVSLLSGADATRERLLELAPRARWLHVATHGWFASESIRSWADPEPIDAKSGLALRQSGEEQVKGMSPMLLCGLALAGANLPENAVGRAPGLVTAGEIAALDLTQCELVVLSACDTNVGERRAGQGVASLQMALQMAGARSVVTSLWKVPDEATKELMLDFYRRLWVEKKPKWQALKEAKRKLRDAKDERGAPKHTLRDWAAWVLTGEPD